MCVFLCCSCRSCSLLLLCKTNYMYHVTCNKHVLTSVCPTAHRASISLKSEGGGDGDGGRGVAFVTATATMRRRRRRRSGRAKILVLVVVVERRIFLVLLACFLVCEANVTRGRWREVSGPARICKQDVEKSAGLQYYMSSCRQGGVAQLNI